MSLVVAVLIFDQVDLLDVGGPYEVFLTANRLAERDGRQAIFDVITVGPTVAPVTAFGGLTLTPRSRALDLAAVDIAVIPGAVTIDQVAGSPEVSEAVDHLTKLASITTSVCTGAFLLGDHKMLDEVPWTTHWEDIDLLADRIGSTAGVRERWVDAGPVITSGGLSSGMAMALHLVDRLAGRELAEATAHQIDYAWNPDDGLIVE